MYLRTRIALLIVCFVAFGSQNANGDLVMSLHMDDNAPNQTNVATAGPLAARDTNGNANTVGQLPGSINFLHGDASVTESDIMAFSGTTRFTDLNRFGNSANGGAVLTWDFDVSTLSASDIYEFSVFYTAETKPAAHNLGFYVSYSDGAGLSLDTTDVTTQTPGANALVVSNTAEYVSLLALDASTGGQSLTIDVSGHVQTAINNGGNLRIAFVDNTFRNTITFTNETGISVVAVPEPGSACFIGLFAVGLLARRRQKR